MSSMPVFAQDIPGYPAHVDGYDVREVAMLPRYCIYTQLFRDSVPGGSNQDEIARHTALIGPMFHHMHHYCWGLMKTNRAVLLARSQQVRMAYLADAVGEYDYVIRHADHDFILLPEILTKKAENLIRLGKGSVALFDLERAAEIKPDYWPPYAQMSDYYKDTGDITKARETLEKGLSFSPDAPALKRRLSELDQRKSPAKAATAR
jgi:tetratricopeptide (TPR) repeat protein